MTPLVEARGLALPGRLQPTDLAIEPGAMVALIGPNGSGKTSLLRVLAGIEGNASSLDVDGERLSAAPPARRRRLLAFLPASREFGWPIRARDVIRLGLDPVDPARIEALLSLLELDALADRPVSALSTGERARVLLARALAPRARLLLLDEPLSNLDPYWAIRILDIVRAETSGGSAALVSVHDIDRVAAFDRALLMDGGELVADLAPGAMLASDALESAFGIERRAGDWRISSRAGPRSSP